jgi:hypothetical protein
MNEMKKLYSCIILLFAIYVLIETVSGLLSVSVAFTKINIYSIVVGEILLYIAIIYFVFFRLKTIPKFKLWFIFLIFVFFFISKNFFYDYTMEELVEYATAMDLKIMNKIIFKFVFAVFACIKYYKIKE